MAMTPKYYTPVLAEFHVGFECEVDYEGWEKTTIEMSPISSSLVARISRKNKLIHIVVTEDSMSEYRVKHLDREDIESLGWISKSNINYYFINEGIIWNYELHIYRDGKTITISNGGNRDRFEGIIKNKSELKKLMLQLGIN